MSSAYIRWAIRRDMPEVLQIDRTRSESDILALLQQRDHIGMVAEIDNKIVGTMIYQLHPRKLVIRQFAVARGFRRRGIGRQMMTKLINKLSGGRRTRIVLRVPESHLSALLFLRSQGFQAVRVDRDHYDELGEDGIVLRHDLQASYA